MENFQAAHIRTWAQVEKGRGNKCFPHNAPFIENVKHFTEPPEDKNLRGHPGFHAKSMELLVNSDNFQTWLGNFHKRFRQHTKELKAVPDIVLCCNHGRHRSPASGVVISQCLRHSYPSMTVEIEHLGEFHGMWDGMFCQGMCAGCTWQAPPLIPILPSEGRYLIKRNPPEIFLVTAISTWTSKNPKGVRIPGGAGSTPPDVPGYDAGSLSRLGCFAWRPVIWDATFSCYWTGGGAGEPNSAPLSNFASCRSLAHECVGVFRLGESGVRLERRCFKDFE